MPSPDAARPGSVRLAVILLRVIAVGYLLDAVFLLAGVGGFADDVTNRLAASDVDQSIIPNMRPFASGTAVVSGLVVLVAGIVLLIVSRGVSRGSQAARVITWVAAGLALSCNVCAFGSSGWPGFAGVGFVTARSVDANGTFHTFAERVPDGYPLAYRIFSTTVAVAAMVGLVLVIVLLARKPVHNYFRPAPPMPRWLPMQPYPGMPYPPPMPPGAGYPAPTLGAGFPPAMMPGAPPTTTPGFPPATMSGGAGGFPGLQPVPSGLGTDERRSRLDVLNRRKERGEITEAEFQAARREIEGP
jgi:hypothetical protein